MRTVLYHANCFDGFAAAWVVRKALTDSRLDPIRFIPMQYGDPLPEVMVTDPGFEIYMVDYSRPRHEILALRNNHLVMVLDHHKTAEKALEGIPGCYFDLRRSGATMAWEFFFPGTVVPKFLLYIEDRDLWNWALPRSRQISAFVQSFPFDFSIWDEIISEFDDMFDSNVQQGTAILRYQQRTVDVICKQANLILIGGHMVPAVNSNVLMSEVGEALCNLYPAAKFGAYYFDRADEQRQWGLRSKEFDVSEVAKLYGGGGHKLAAGFQTAQTWRGEYDSHR